MKAIIEFNLDDPEDKAKHDLFLKEENMRAVLLDLQQKLRNNLKYCDFISQEQRDILEKFQVEFHEILDDYNIKL